MYKRISAEIRVPVKEIIKKCFKEILKTALTESYSSEESGAAADEFLSRNAHLMVSFLKDFVAPCPKKENFKNYQKHTNT